MRKDDILKDVIKGQVEAFKHLSQQNDELFAEFDDAYFKGKSHSYLLASQTLNKILADFYGESYN
jgi:hypothetical protein